MKQEFSCIPIVDLLACDFKMQLALSTKIFKIRNMAMQVLPKTGLNIFGSQRHIDVAEGATPNKQKMSDLNVGRKTG